MKIHKLKLCNFRKFRNSDFTFHPQFTVLIGDNASGKTSILDAVSIMLGAYLWDFKSSSGRNIHKDEVRLKFYEKSDLITQEAQYPVKLECIGQVHEKKIKWGLETFNGTYTRRGQAKEIIGYGRDAYKLVMNGKDVELPVITYYGIKRFEQPYRESEIGSPDSRTLGYHNCFAPKSIQNFLKWFKQLELSALQKKKKLNILEAVRESVQLCIPGCKKFFYDIALNDLMVELETEGYCAFYNLSDGYRKMLAIVADIAHRAARLNPHMGADTIKRSTGVVLIDEINLHLHPKWQRRVVDDLKRVFPKIQFIVTTHSPFIVQSLAPGQVIDMNRLSIQMEHESSETEEEFQEDIASPIPEGEYSHRSIEDIVENVMGIDMPQRSLKYKKMYETAKEYYTLLQEARNADSDRKEELKIKLDELSAPFSDNVAYHAFLEMERLAAGLGKSDNGE